MDCELCFETFNKIDHLPKVLQYCGHSFCQMCLGHLVNAKGLLQCPVCRYEIAAGAQQPPTNFALLQAIETLENEREGKGLSRFYKPRYTPFGCAKWDDLP
jgi:ribosomal protein L37AE/L43A